MSLRHCLQDFVPEAGCDEAGRGCLAGPVFAAAVVLPVGFYHPLLNDSKQLSESARQALRPAIEKAALAWSVHKCCEDEIEQLNILWASVRAMTDAASDLSVRPGLLLVDGNRFRPVPGMPHRCVVGGDGLYASIAAASVLAKTHRDEWMEGLHREHPQYGWAQNKGYGTQAHRAALEMWGPTKYHRKGFRLGGSGDAQNRLGRQA